MKKISVLILALLLSLSLFAGCKTTEVTEENVAELFKPSLECYLYFEGTALAELERDDNGNLVYYQDEGEMEQCRVVNYDDAEDLFSDMEKYMTEKIRKTVAYDRMFKSDGSDLYVTLFGAGGFSYDLNSIKLLKYEDGKYYITVDALSSGDSLYPELFVTTLKDGILRIEEVEPQSESSFMYDADKDGADRNFISNFDKIYSR